MRQSDMITKRYENLKKQLFTADIVVFFGTKTSKLSE